MKIVTYQDDNGYKRSALLRDNDPDHAAPLGIPVGPPDINQLDWEEIKRELHNLLLDRGLVSWQAVQESSNGVSSSILQIIKPRIIQLYKTMETKL